MLETSIDVLLPSAGSFCSDYGGQCPGRPSPAAMTQPFPLSFLLFSPVSSPFNEGPDELWKLKMLVGGFQSSLDIKMNDFKNNDFFSNFK